MADPLINIFLLLIHTTDYKAKMIIVFYNLDPFPIQNPWFYILVIFHIMLGACDNSLGLAWVEHDPVLVGVVTDYVQ